MYVARYNAKGYSESAISGYAKPDTAMRSAKLRLRNQEAGTVAVYEEDSESPHPIALATKENWKWTNYKEY